MFDYGSLQRNTKNGYTSVWHFAAACGEYYAFGGCHKPLIKRFASVEELMLFYQEMVGYGYTPLPTIAATH